LYGLELARYGLNGLGLAIIGYGWLVSRSRRTGPIQTPTMDSAQFARTLDDARALDTAVAELRDALDPVWAVITWRDPHDSLAVGTYLLTSYPFVLVLTYFVPLPYIFGALGTLFLTWHAPWLKLIRRAMTKSLVGRWLGRVIFGILGGGRGLGQELVRGTRGFALFRNALTYTAAPPKSASAKGPAPVPESAVTAKNERGGDLHYTFTVYENQRWWVGLDWTQALLPNERPSWCVARLRGSTRPCRSASPRSDAHHAPVSPPSTFLLPATSTALTPSADGRSQVKRTTEWRWIDDWTVRAATQPVSPTMTSPSKAGNRTSMIDWRGKLSQSLGAGRRGSDSALPPPNKDLIAAGHARQASETDDLAAAAAAAGGHADGEGGDWDCDEAGWQYGDNAWQPLSAKGKIGRCALPPPLARRRGFTLEQTRGGERGRGRRW
jgi:hypothetical protein